MGWGAVAGVAGSVLGGIASAKGAKSANEAQMGMSREQMQWQERMSNTAHQREVKDLRAAGLNPLLSATGGMGASTPSGSTTSVRNEIGAGVASAIEALTKITQAFLTREQTKQTEAQADLTKAQTTNTMSDTILKSEQHLNVRADAKLKGEQANTARATTRNILEDTKVKQMAQKVQMSEIDKNNQFTNLLNQQRFTEQQKTLLTGTNALSAIESLKQMKNEGSVSDTQYGQVMEYIKRFFDALPFSGSVGTSFKR